MPTSMNIGQAAQATGVSPKMIRHYEAIGLLPPPPRNESGYRQYGERELSVLRFIRQARLLGFSTESISELVGLWSDTRRASRTVRALAQRHVHELERRMDEMAQMKLALERLIHACHGDDDPHCAILDSLAADSPSAPEGHVELHRKPRAAKRQSGATKAASASAAHAGLMAWTHQRQPRSSGGV